MKLVPRITQKNDLKIVGIEIRTSNKLEANPASARIPGLWKRFYAEGVLEKIQDKATRHVFGTYSDYESDQNGEYSLIVGCEVDKLDEIPAGMVGKVVPASRYLIFTAKGDMPKAVVDAWGSIWSYFSNGAPQKRAFTVDFEMYDREKPDEVDIYVAVK